MKSENNEVKVREDIGSLIAKILVAPAVKAAHAKIAQDVKDDPDAAKALNNLQASHAAYIKSLKRMCTAMPGSDYCKELEKILKAQR